MALTSVEKPTVERSNADWLTELRGGQSSRRAFADLQRLLHRVLSRALRAHPVDDDAIADFVQESLIKINDSLDSFRGDSRFTTWASAVSVRTALTTLRRAHWRDVRLDSTDLDTLQIESGPMAASTPERAARRTEMENLMQQMIADELTSRQRQVILGELAGIPQELLLARLGINRNALYKLAHDARRKLKAAMERAGIRPEDVRDLFQPSSE